MNLVCVICLFTEEGEATEAVVIAGGYSVCEGHIHYVQGDALSRAIASILQAKRQDSRL